MPTRVWVRLPVCRRICGYVKARVCACTRMRVACTCMRVCERARALRACMCVCLQVCMCVRVRASCVCMHVRVRRWMSVCPRTRMPAWMPAMPALRLCERPSVCLCARLPASVPASGCVIIRDACQARPHPYRTRRTTFPSADRRSSRACEPVALPGIADLTA